jgi:hypothetical protein
MRLSERTKTIMSSADFTSWLEVNARELFGMGAQAFLMAYHAGAFAGNRVASYLACVEPLLDKVVTGSHDDAG